MDDLEVQCGLAFGAIDLTDAQVTRLIEINCDETPEEAECVRAE